MINRAVWLLIVLSAAGAACSKEQRPTRSNTANPNDEAVLYAEDFDDYRDGTLPSDWWVEGGEAVRVQDGKLLIEADPETERGPGHACTVWNRQKFSGDVQVEFDAHVVASSMDVNNINFFFLYSHPSPDSTLYETRATRQDGSYNHYHDLNGYIFTFVNADRPEDDAARFRMRRCPGFELMEESYAHHSRERNTYHITITKRSDSLIYQVDGQARLRGKDDKYSWSHGLMGLRTFHTDLWIDNVKVTRAERQDTTSAFE